MKCEGLRGVQVFRLVKRCVCTFFFFLNFGLTRPFRPIQADTDRVSPIWAASAPISTASARFGTCHVARRGTDARSAASLPRRRVPPRRTRVRWPGSRVRASQYTSYVPLLTVAFGFSQVRKETFKAIFHFKLGMTSLTYQPPAASHLLFIKSLPYLRIQL